MGEWGVVTIVLVAVFLGALITRVRRGSRGDDRQREVGDSTAIGVYPAAMMDTTPGHMREDGDGSGGEGTPSDGGSATPDAGSSGGDSGSDGDADGGS